MLARDGLHTWQTGIAPGKLHPLLGNTVYIWCFVKSGPFIGEVAGTEIVHQNEDHIGLTWRVSQGGGG